MEKGLREEGHIASVREGDFQLGMKETFPKTPLDSLFYSMTATLTIYEKISNPCIYLCPPH